MRILSSSVNGMSTNNQRRQKCVVFALVIFQQIKEIIANGHALLNKFMIAQTA